MCVYYNSSCFVFQPASRYSSRLPTTLLYKLLLGFRCRSSCLESCSCLWLWINQLKENFKASVYGKGKQSHAISQLNSHVFFIWVIIHATCWFKRRKLKQNQLKQTRNVFLFFDIEMTYHSGASTQVFLRIFLIFVFSLTIHKTWILVLFVVSISSESIKNTG